MRNKSAELRCDTAALLRKPMDDDSEYAVRIAVIFNFSREPNTRVWRRGDGRSERARAALEENCWMFWV